MTTYTAPAEQPHNVAAADLATTGHTQLVVTCPGCAQLHRHLGPGIRRGPCGSWYIVTPPAPDAHVRAR